jgi:hypothetical protein
MRRSGAPPGRGEKCVDRALGKTRSRHSDQCVAAFDGGDSPRHSPPKSFAQAARLRRAISLIRRRFEPRSIMFAADLLREAAP